MKIGGIIWLRNIVDKLAFKHHVETHEVEEVKKTREALILSARDMADKERKRYGKK